MQTIKIAQLENMFKLEARLREEEENLRALERKQKGKVIFYAEIYYKKF